MPPELAAAAKYQLAITIASEPTAKIDNVTFTVDDEEPAFSIIPTSHE